MDRSYALITGNSNGPLWQPFHIVWPVIELVEFALLLRLQLIELVGRVAGGVALYARSRDIIRSAVELLAVLVDYFEIEIFGGFQSPGLGEGDLAGTRGGLRLGGLTRAATEQHRRHQHQCTHTEHPFESVGRAIVAH